MKSENNSVHVSFPYPSPSG